MSVYPDDFGKVDRVGLQRVIDSRSSPDIRRSIKGALVTLDDMQIRDRAGLHSSLYDYCRPGEHTCNYDFLVNTHGGRLYKPHTLDYKKFIVRNVPGEWASTVHFLPARLGDREGEAKVAIQDSNIFSTLGVLFPLYIIDDSGLPTDQQFVARMRTLAASSMARYKRGEAYNFWIESPGETSDQPKVGPFNIPVALTRPVAKMATGSLGWLWRCITGKLDVHVEDWVCLVLDKHQNPYGFDAAYNIPDDADDTASVVAMQTYHFLRQPDDGVEPDKAALALLTRYRDLARTKRDDRAQWKGADATGAYLTWLKDENLPTFATPRTGVIPRGVNNVDCVINANALFAFAVNGETAAPGFDAARRLLYRTIGEKRWISQRCGIYYPQLMMFPYAITRAWREGAFGADSGSAAMSILLSDLLAMQDDDGSFPGGKDKTRVLSTALGVNALINIGAATAASPGLLPAYENAIAKGVAWLVYHRQPRKVRFDQTFAAGNASAPTTGYTWQSGLFFASSYWDLAQWRSEPYTTAVTLEALAKFALAYDIDDASVLRGRKLRVDAWEESDDIDGLRYSIGWQEH